MASADDYRRVDLGRAPKAGEYGQVNPTDTYPNAPTELIPSPGDPERQFSSNVSGDPRDLARESDDSQSAFSSLQEFLNNNLQTAGSRVCNDQKQSWKPAHGAEGDKQ
jgi:hypothetical protein